MKKNTMMRIASVLLVAVLLSTCTISGTFAKYVTSGTGSDTAQVAKFGVTITANGTMFANEYATDDTTVSGVIAKSVLAASGTSYDLVAPGTTKELVNATITGTPEVAVNVTYAPTLTITGWTWDADNDPSTDAVEYFPVIFTVNGQTYGITGMKDHSGNAPTNTSDTVAALVTAVQNAISAFSADYAPNTNLSTIGTDGYVHVSWEWAFEGNNDTADTALGDAAASGSPATIALEIVTTVTQID